MTTLLPLIAFFVKSAVAARSGVSLPISYETPAEGYVSLALYDSQGTLVRTMLYAEPVHAGRHSLAWDGTTDLGLPATPGEYRVQGIFFDKPPAIDYVMKVGKSGNPPYRHPTGDWGSNLSYPTTLAANGESLLMAWGAVEDTVTTGVQLTDADGGILGRYFTFYPWDARSAAAMDDGRIYLGIYNITGRSTADKKTEIAVYELGNPRGRILAELPVEPAATASGRWEGRAFSAVDGMAILGDRLYAGVAHANALFVIDRESGEIRRRVEVPGVRGVTASNERLFAVSGCRVLELSPEGEVKRVLVGEGLLEAPYAITSDTLGNIYVGDSGAYYNRDPQRRGGTRQVHVFSPNGKLLRSLGRKGGAPCEGRFHPDAFGVITAMTIGPGGKLWVMDIATGFHRTSRWSSEGKLERQWFSRKIQHWADVIDPAQPDVLLSARDGFDDSPSGLYAYRIDLAGKSWEPAWSYPLTRDRIYGPAQGVFTSHDHGGNPLAAIDSNLCWPIFDYARPSYASRGERHYLFAGSGNGEGAIHLYSADHAPKPAGLISFHRVEKKNGVFQGSYDSGPNNWMTWADYDGDGRMSADEVIFTEDPENLKPFKRVLDARMAEDLSIHMVLLPVREGQADLAYAVLPLKERLSNGATVYDWKDVRIRQELAMPDLRGGDGTEITRYSWDTPLVTEDALYSIVDPSAREAQRLPGLDGDGWWASRNWRKRLVRWDKESGKPLWAVGRRAPGVAEPGQMHNPVWLSGVADGAVFLADALGVVWVWDTRGLYLGRLYNAMPDQPQDADTLYIELMGTEIFTHPRTGRIYSIANDFGASIHEVTLPDRRPIEGGTVTLDAEQVRQAKPWDPEGPDPATKPEFTAYPTSAEITIDGNLDGREHWSRLPSGQSMRTRSSMMVLMDGERLAEVRAMYDKRNLYLGYRVWAPNGPRNVGSELPYAPFVSGAYVDFYVAPDWRAPQRERVLDGDVRVLLARIGKELKEGTVFQHGFWQIRDQGEHPWEITSPAATVHFDNIAEVPGLKAAYKVEDADPKTGRVPYTVEVAVPLESLGLDDPLGRSIGFDVSIGVADDSGTERTRAAHWAGLTEGRVVDRPGSTRLLPHTWGTLRFAGE